jgi:hypothetical protein
MVPANGNMQVHIKSLVPCWTKFVLFNDVLDLELEVDAGFGLTSSLCIGLPTAYVPLFCVCRKPGERLHNPAAMRSVRSCVRFRARARLAACKCADASAPNARS